MTTAKKQRNATYRTAARLHLEVEARVGVANQSLSVTVEDLSRWGAGIRTPVKPPGERFKIEIGDLELASTLIWSRRGRCGLRFNKPLSKEQIDYLNHIAEDPSAFVRVKPTLFTRLRLLFQ